MPQPASPRAHCRATIATLLWVLLCALIGTPICTAVALAAQTRPATKPTALDTPATAPNFAGFVSGPYFSATGTSTIAATRPLIADVTADGKPDIITFGGGVICVRPGNGDGTFAAPILSAPAPNTNFAIDLTQLEFSVVADLNGDGSPDLIVATASAVATYLNDGHGSFSGNQELTPNNAAGYSIDGNIASVLLGKLTTSAVPDILILENETASQIASILLRNDGAGRFTQTTISLVSAPGFLIPGGPTAALSDINGDGKLDLVFEAEQYQHNSVQVQVALGNGDGSFQTSSQAPPIAVNPADLPFGAIPNAYGIHATNLAVTSLSGDPRKQDILLASPHGLFIARGNGDGTFGAQQPALPGDALTGYLEAAQQTYFLTYSLQTSDLNGDGKPDLLVIDHDAIVAYLNQGSGVFGPVSGTASATGNVLSTVSLDPNGYSNQSPVSQTAVADLNGDGRPDLVSGDIFNGYLTIALGNGDGTFRAVPLLGGVASPQVSPFSFVAQVAADLNGDGLQDLLAYSRFDGTLVSALSTGKGTFQYKQALPATAFTTSLVQQGIPTSVLAQGFSADFNGDGLEDFVIVGENYSVAVALSRGDGTLATPVVLSLPQDTTCLPQSFAAGDINGDGHADLIIAYPGDIQCANFDPPANPRPSGYFVALGKGDGTFGANPAFVPFGNAVEKVALARLHGPAHPLDLVVSEFNDTSGVASPLLSFAVLAGKGDGTFGPPAQLDTAHGVSNFVTDDYNGDGKLDLTLFCFSQTYGDPISGPLTVVPGGVYRLPGNGDGTFGAEQTVIADETFSFVTGRYADVNGDGTLDLLLSPVSETPSDRGITLLLGDPNGSFSPPLYYPASMGTPLIGNFLGDNTVSVAGAFQATTALLINQGGTALALTPSAATLPAGANLTLNAALTPTLSGRPAPTGTLTLLDGATPVGTATLSNGAAQFTLATLAQGAHSLTATYPGDPNFQPNHSAALAVSVTAALPPPPAPDYTFTLSAPQLTIARGQSGTLTLSVAANSTLSAAVTFACSGLPAEATCTASPATLSVKPGQTGTATVTIATAAASSAVLHAENHRSLPLAGGGIALAALLLLLPRSRTRGIRTLGLLVLCAALGTGALLGCGGGSSRSASSSNPATPADPGTPAGNATVTVTATALSGATAITHTAELTLAVQ